MSIFRKRDQGRHSTERRHYLRRQAGGSRVYLYALGECAKRCLVRDISRAGMFIETSTHLPLALPVELAFTCMHTYRVVKIYRRSAYIARVAEEGVVALFFDRAWPGGRYG
jgi:hypothetical protein